MPERAIRGRLATGKCGGAKPLCQGFGSVPQDWGTQGAEKGLVNAFLLTSYYTIGVVEKCQQRRTEVRDCYFDPVP
jgi:hypothetical protein